MRATRSIFSLRKQGASLEAAQKAKLGRRKAVIQEINSALLKARDKQWLVPPELAKSIDEAVNADPPPGKAPRSASKDTLEAAHGLYQVFFFLTSPMGYTPLSHGLHLECFRYVASLYGWPGLMPTKKYPRLRYFPPFSSEKAIPRWVCNVFGKRMWPPKRMRNSETDEYFSRPCRGRST
jgi:hypothetical protein